MFRKLALGVVGKEDSMCTFSECPFKLRATWLVYDKAT